MLKLAYLREKHCLLFLLKVTYLNSVDGRERVKLLAAFLLVITNEAAIDQRLI